MRKRFRLASMECGNKKRLSLIIQPGDKIQTYVRHREIGFYAELEVRSVSHWGVNAILRGDEAKKQSKNLIKEFHDGLIKRQFLVKWCNIQGFVLI